MEYTYVYDKDKRKIDEMTMIRCGTECSSGLLSYPQQNGQVWCLEYCPETAIFEGDGKCLEHCPAYVLKPKGGKEVMICQDICGSSTYSSYKYFEQNGTSKHCIEKCDGDNKYLVDG